MIGLCHRNAYDIEHGLPGESLEFYLIIGALLTGVISILAQDGFAWTWGTLGRFLLSTLIGYGIQVFLWTRPKEMHRSTRLAFSWLCVLVAAGAGLALAILQTSL